MHANQTRPISLHGSIQVLQGIQKNQQLSFYLGFLLLVVILGMQLVELHWVWLSTLQANELYKRWSGFGLLLYIAAQWYLSALRIHGKTEAAKQHYQIHKQLGILAPLVFYLHSMKLGYAYLLLLSIVYLANVAVGLCNREFVKIKNERFMYYWMIVHVALSVCTVALAIYHLFIVFYYE